MALVRRASVLAAALVAACSGEKGPAGPAGPTGPAGGTGPGGQNAWVVGPGLQVTVTGAAVAADGAASVTFRIADGAGVALERTGRLTAGAVDLGFVLASLGEVAVPGGTAAGAYTPHTTRLATSGGTSSVQGVAESTGTFADLGDGSYRYAFAARGDPTLRARTHSVAVLASRTFDGVRHVADASLDFRPDGGAIAVRPALVADAACSACHGELRAHGGLARGMARCALCHAPGALDPDTGSALDLRVMVHRIHRGRDLASVVAGTPYRLVDDAGASHDYSTVGFPQEIARCATCHGAPGDDRWSTRPSRAVCTSCHDTTSFEPSAPAGSVAHSGGAQADDGHCLECHGPTGPSPVAGRHRPALDAAPSVEATILAVTSAGPGQQPAVDFQVTVDGQPRDLVAAPLTRLVLTLAGPTTDYATSWQSTVQGSGATGTLTALGGPGQFRYTVAAAAAIPVAATGSYAAALEGYLQPLPTDPRAAATPAPFFFAVTDAGAVPRRAPVTTAACATCHHRLAAHGGTRSTVEYCAFCHNPTKANDQRVARLEGATVVASSVDLKVMIHAIHRGPAHAQPYVLGGFPVPSAANPAGTPIDFTAVRYPSDLRRCSACHAPGSPTLPLGATALPSTELTLGCTEPPANDTDGYCSAPYFAVTATRHLPPTAAACAGCHDDASTAVHAQVNTTAAGEESCATCHGPGSAYDLARVHGLSP